MASDSSTESAFGFTTEELTGLGAIVSTIAVLSWLMTDTTGGTRIVSTVLAALAALITAAALLWLLRRRGD